MPSNYAQPADPQPDAQTKLCSSCQSTFLDPAASLFCTLCRDRPSALPAQLRIDQDVPSPRRPLDSHTTPPPPFDTPDAPPLYHPPTPSYAKKPLLSNIQCNISSPAPTTPHRHQSHFSAVPSFDSTPTRQHSNPAATATAAATTTTQAFPDPLADVTRLRIRSRAHHCLYPGATFQGTQKSGRNSYDVNVTIVDVNFAASTLCGYLRIRGLTDDWPELTTYFDAEIIGNRYGFLTQNWGATQHEDLVHWSRFPAFKHIRHEAQRPHMTLDDRDRGVVFMRWKERFLVPDHLVQDINGASFAGFYYVCVDFNPPATPSSPTDCAMEDSTLQMPLTPESDDMSPYPPPSSRKTGRRSRSRRDSSVRRRGPSLIPINPPVATMSGFYYHQNSEP
ncbi:hypothetical protein GALMADRAFT_615219 [Galerina marginata CBS 339.88]|uniref:Vacuolar import and degradation protein-domain-containing protein n=1 Tax=Galerina marginata (strain CBS 339.88) TaxID=685588 RepID=A0A067SU04_GALM3|nr:hypothetical protein GALMADRAFT_615219 [Galerina marginata CBS 339.88]